MADNVEDLYQTALGKQFLEHFGVKGMRWGVRNSVGSSPSKPKMSKVRDDRGNLLTKDDVKWAKKTKNMRKGMDAYNKTADVMNTVTIPKINNDPRYRDVDFTNPKNAKIKAKYLAEYKASFDKEFNKNLKAVYGDSPSGQYKVRVSSDSEPGLWTVDYNEIRHAEGDFKFNIIVKENDLGHIVEFEIQNDDLVHFGIKGMHWGIRRSQTVLDREAPSDDYRRATEAKTKLKKSGSQALSNKEMQDLVTRMNLEKQLSTLSQTKNDKYKMMIETNLNQALNKGMKQALNYSIQYGFDQLTKNLNNKKK